MDSKWEREGSSRSNACNMDSEGRKRELLARKGAKRTHGHCLSCFFSFLFVFKPTCQIEMTDADRKHSSFSRLRKSHEGLETV